MCVHMRRLSASMSTVRCRSPSCLCKASRCIASGRHARSVKMPGSAAAAVQWLCRCEDESIDELAAFLGVGEAVAALTARQAS